MLINLLVPDLEKTFAANHHQDQEWGTASHPPDPLILVVLLRTSGRGTWTIGHLILIYIHESATANAPLTINI